MMRERKALARAVINATRDAEREAERVKLLPLIGRCFKTRNSYGGKKPKRWWYYFLATGVTSYGPMEGWSFQLTSDSQIDIRLNDHVWCDRSGWQECSVGEFKEAFSTIQGTVAALLNRAAKNEQTKVRRLPHASDRSRR